MGEPLPISVVIPTYNAAAFLAEALESVRAQTRAAAEVIVVDNGSTDASAAIAEEAGARVLRLAHPGLSAARNAGIRAATQPWIAFLDADDLWDPDKLALQWQAVEASPQAGLLITDFTEFDSTGVRIRSFFEQRENYQAIRRREVAPSIVCCDSESFQMHFMRGNFFTPSAVLTRRQLLLDVGLFDEGISHIEDRECWLRLMNRTVVAVVERPVVHTRIHDSNWSSNLLKMALGAALISERVLAHPEQYPACALDYYRAERPRYYLNAGRYAEENGDLRGAGRHYLSAWRTKGGVRPLALALLTRFPGSIRRVLRAGTPRPSHAPQPSGVQ